jgi:hypothetical protein
MTDSAGQETIAELMARINAIRARSGQEPLPARPWLSGLEELAAAGAAQPAGDASLLLRAGPVERFRAMFSGVASWAVGKNFGVLGPRAAGKTTLQIWLRDGQLVKDPGPTLAASDMNSVWRRRRSTAADVGRTGLILKRGLDVPGDRKTNMSSWRRVVRDAHYLVYMFDAARVLAGEREHRLEISADCSTVGQLIRDERGVGRWPKVAVVGTHCDQAPGYAPPSDKSTHLAFKRRLEDVEALSDAQYLLRLNRGTEEDAPLLLGSLDSPEGAEELSVRLLNELKRQ